MLYAIYPNVILSIFASSLSAIMSNTKLLCSSVDIVFVIVQPGTAITSIKPNTELPSTIVIFVCTLLYKKLSSTDEFDTIGTTPISPGYVVAVPTKTPLMLPDADISLLSLIGSCTGSFSLTIAPLIFFTGVI